MVLDLDQLLLNEVPDALIVMTPEAVVVGWNKGAQTMFGYPESEAVGRPLADIIVHPGRQEEERRVFQETLDTGFATFETVRRRKDGSPVRVNVTSKVLRDEQGRVQFVLSTKKDVTHLKAADGMLAISAIRDVTERKRFEQSLRAASRMKGEFLANMSHELRTPLNGIIGFSEFLIDEKPGELNPKQREYLTDILNSGRYLLQLINDILDLSKVEAGKMPLSPVPFPLAQAVEEVCSVFTPLAHEKRIVIERSISPLLSDVVLDPQKFKQVLYNLLSNAIKFNRDGGRIEIAIVPREPDRLQVQVRDTGIGIRAEDVPRLFVEFEQLESEEAHPYQGSGLGLALTRKLVELQAGAIRVDSELGKGSTFTVDLPLVAPVPA